MYSKIILANKLRPTIQIPEAINSNFNNQDKISISYNIKEFLKDYIPNLEFMAKKYDGIGIAANQIGIPYSIFLIASKTLLNDSFDIYLNPTYESITPPTEIICQNEACLSVPGYELEVPRQKEILASWFSIKDENTLTFNQEILKNTRARVYLHEYDHLVGKSIIDYQSRAIKRKILKELSKI